MLRFAYFVLGFVRKTQKTIVFQKHNEKIKVSSNFHGLNTLQHLRLRGVYLELRV